MIKMLIFISFNMFLKVMVMKMVVFYWFYKVFDEKSEGSASSVADRSINL